LTEVLASSLVAQWTGYWVLASKNLDRLFRLDIYLLPVALKIM